LKIFTFFDKKRGKLGLNRLDRTLLGIQNVNFTVWINNKCYFISKEDVFDG